MRELIQALLGFNFHTPLLRDIGDYRNDSRYISTGIAFVVPIDFNLDVFSRRIMESVKKRYRRRIFTDCIFYS